MATTATRKAMVARVTKKSNGEPEINPMNYQASLMLALNYYSCECDNKQKKGWFMDRFRKEAKFPMGDIHDREFRIAGTLARILANGNHLEQNELDRLESEFHRIKAMSKKPEVVEEPTTAVKVPSVQERMEEKASEFVAEFNGIVDEFVMDRKAIPDVDLLVKQKQPIPAPIAKKIVAKVQRTLNELQEAVAGTDAYLNEGYKNFKKTELKKLLSAYQTLVDRLQQMKKVVVRKARTPKAKPVGTIVARMKFSPANDELKLKSVSPTSIVGADELYCFNTKTRKMQVYKALDGMTLTVKGTTIMNYDMEKSLQKTVRKPETVAPVAEKGKRAFAAFMKALTAKPAPLNGRIGADTILLATFK